MKVTERMLLSAILSRRAAGQAGRRNPALIRSELVQTGPGKIETLQNPRSWIAKNWRESMLKKSLLMALTAIVATTSIASAQNYSPPPGSDPQGYYSRYDGDG